MNYPKMAEAIRHELHGIRTEKGKLLISAMKSHWRAGGKEFRIPPGEYVLTQPIPLPPMRDGLVYAKNDVVLQCPHLNYFANYDPMKGEYVKYDSSSYITGGFMCHWKP
jgi:hypothetical protein